MGLSGDFPGAAHIPVFFQPGFEIAQQESSGLGDVHEMIVSIRDSNAAMGDGHFGFMRGFEIDSKYALGHSPAITLTDRNTP